MAKRLFLEVRSEPAYYTLLGLSTQLKDYRLSFLLNKIPGFQFSRLDEFPVRLPDIEEPVLFSIYSCEEEEGFNTFTLLSNRNGDQFLVPSLRQSDYLLIIEGPLKKQRKDDLLKSLRAIPGMLLAAEISPSSVKSFESLVADLEMQALRRKEKTHNQHVKQGGTYV
ncbi:MAG: IPExxxVDY family protein [Bacteroidetes bacterium]|nr:MAG: IPExxxVDY family protein [Bacteroidota bacterium]